MIDEQVQHLIFLRKEPTVTASSKKKLQTSELLLLSIRKKIRSSSPKEAGVEAVKARSEGVTVIHFCGKWFQTFLRQFSTNHAEFLIWCRNCIKEEPLSRIFQKFQNFSRISRIFHKIFRKNIYSSKCNCRLIHV